MTSTKTTVLKVLHRRRPPKAQTVHEILSKIQTAYSVFVPMTEDELHLFQIIFLSSDRPNSPRNTTTNLKGIIQDLRDDPNIDQEGTVASFKKEFRKVVHRNISDKPPAIRIVSKESLLRAGFTFPTPGPTISSGVSASQSVHHKVRLSWRSSYKYTGAKLRLLIWKHAEEVFRLIIQQLESTQVSTTKGDRSLMGIVTKRIISVVGVSRLEEKAAAASLMAGYGQGLLGWLMGAGKAKKMQEVYEDMHGVSGLHFIVFRVECLDRHRWRFYRGIDVCNFELDETSSPDSLQRDDFHQALLWRDRTENVRNARESDFKTVTDEDSAETQANTNDSSVDGQTTDGNPEYVDIVNTSPTAPFVDIDITPFLSEFANKQCKLAAYYRKTDAKDSEKSEAVTLLRSALRKCRFESMIRALYDLSGCYFHGIGVQTDVEMARLLRYCAGGMRRNYGTRTRWLKRLDMEIGLRQDEEPERRIGMMALLSRRSLVWLRAKRTKEAIVPMSITHKEVERPRKEFDPHSSEVDLYDECTDPVYKNGERPHERIDWARMRKKMGNTLLQKQDGDPIENIERAVQCYEEALRVFTRKTYPSDWALTKMRLGIAFATKQNGDRIENIEKAVQYFEEALQVFTRETYPREWALTKTDLGFAFTNKQNGDRIENIEKALRYYEEALQVCTSETYPSEWALTKMNLGFTFTNKQNGNRIENIEKVVQYYEEALQVFTRETYPREWALTKMNLGFAFATKQNGDRIENIEKAVQYYEEALQVFTRETYPREWALTKMNLGFAFANKQNGDRIENIERALQCYEDVRSVWTKGMFPEGYMHMLNRLRDLLQLKE